MTSDEDSFRLLRLRFLRPPPSSLFLSSSSSKTSSVCVEIAIGVTDDYGTEGDAFFSSLNLSLSLVDSVTSKLYSHATLSFSDNSLPSNFTIHSSQGHFHTLKPIITFQNTHTKPTSLRFLLSIAKNEIAPTKLSECSQKMRELIGEEDQEPLESWDSSRFIFLRILSGEVEIVMSGKKGEGSSSATKVQTAIRTLHVQLSNSTFPSTPLFAVERPGLNNSTGSRLWDCSIGLTCFLLLNPYYLAPPVPLSSTSTPSLKIIEVGSGCGITSLAALKIIQSITNSQPIKSKYQVDIIQTDIEATVKTTLAENLETNFPTSSSSCRSNHDNFSIRTETLNWGILSESEKEVYLGSEREKKDQYLTILGSDILYDPDSHSLLLETITSLLEPSAGELESEVIRGKAIIAYKARTEGDDKFFELAIEGARRKVEKIWEWGEIQIWSICY